MSDDDNLFSRWSNRKRAVAKEDADRTPPANPDKDTPEMSGESDEVAKVDETEEEVLARFGLPSPESLGPGDDFSGFMQSGVPEFLRRRALRRLWRSNPVLANIDGLNDYDEDFTSPEETMKVLKTAYQVGRGFLRDKVEVDADEAVEEQGEHIAEADASPAIGEDDPSGEERIADAADLGEAEEKPVVSGTSLSRDAEDPAVKRPRRMRFHT